MAIPSPSASAELVLPHRAQAGGRGAGAPAGGTDDAVAPLVRRAMAGDADAFAALVRRFERMALAVACGVLGTARTDLVADAVQEALARAWARLPSLHDPARFAPWLANIVRNAATDLVRRRRRPVICASDAAAAAGRDGLPTGHLVATPDLDPARAVLGRESRDAVAAALARLDETTRCCVVLRYYENLPSRQIGELLGLSPAAVDMRLMRGRNELRRMLADDDHAEGHEP